MTTTVKENHALTNCRGQLESIKELYKEFKKQEDLEALGVGSNVANWTSEGIREKAQDEALSVEFRSGWYSSPESIADLKPEEFKILLAWGGPALRIIGELDEYGPVNPKLQFQDWGTPWTDFEITEDQQKALNWFCNCFYFGG